MSSLPSINHSTKTKFNKNSIENPIKTPINVQVQKRKGKRFMEKSIMSPFISH